MEVFEYPCYWTSNFARGELFQIRLRYDYFNDKKSFRGFTRDERYNNAIEELEIEYGKPIKKHEYLDGCALEFRY